MATPTDSDPWGEGEPAVMPHTPPRDFGPLVYGFDPQSPPEYVDGDCHCGESYHEGRCEDIPPAPGWTPERRTAVDELVRLRGELARAEEMIAGLEHEVAVVTGERDRALAAIDEVLDGLPYRPVEDVRVAGGVL